MDDRWNFRQSVHQKTIKNLDGSPPDYWQVYADDTAPFQFPLPSQWVTKGVVPPNPLMHEFYKHLRQVLIPLFLFIIAGFVYKNPTWVYFGGFLSLYNFYKYIKFIVSVVAPPTDNNGVDSIVSPSADPLPLPSPSQ